MTGNEWLAVFAVAYAGWWLLSRWLWPYSACPWCKDRRGRNAGSNAKRWGRCWRCRGSGERKRFGATLVHRALRAQSQPGRRKQS